MVGSTATVKGTTGKGDSQGRLRRRLRGERPRSGEWGSRCPVAVVACGRLRPGFPVASSPYGSRPVRWYQVGSPSWWSGISDLTPPARPAWLRPPKRRGIRDNPACGKSSRTTRIHHPAAAVPRRVDPVHTTGRGCPGFPVASAVLAQPSRTGRCPAGRNRWPATVIRLDTAQAGMVPSGRRSGGESGTEATTSNVRRRAARPPLPGARPLAAQAPPEALFSLPLTVLLLPLTVAVEPTTCPHHHRPAKPAPPPTRATNGSRKPCAKPSRNACDYQPTNKPQPATPTHT